MTKNNLKEMFFIPFILPILGLYIGLKNIKRPDSHFFILFFAFWFGYSLIFFEGADHTGYKDTYPEIINYDWADYGYLVTHALSLDRLSYLEENALNNKPDLFALTLMFLMTRITDNPRWFFAIIALIYYYLFLRFKVELLNYAGVEDSTIWKIIFLFTMFMLPFHTGVCGVRFWVALYLLMFMTLKNLNTGKNIYIYLMWLSPLIHYTFVIPSLLITIFFRLKLSIRVVRPFLPLLLVFYFISSTTSLTYVSDVLSIFDETSVKDAAGSYTDIEGLNERKTLDTTGNWYVLLHGAAISNMFIIFYFLEIAGFLKLKNNNKSQIDILTFVFFILTLLTAGLGSIGRFRYLFYFFYLVRLLRMLSLKENRVKLQSYNYAFGSVLFLHILVTFRGAFYAVDPLLLIGNPVTLLLLQPSTISLSELLIGH